MVRGQHRFRLHVYIAALFLGLLMVFAATNITMQYFKTREMVLSAASELFRHIDREIRGAIDTRYDAAVLVADLVSKSAITEATSLAERMSRLSIMLEGLKSQAGISAIYVAYQNGDFFLVRPLVPGSKLMQDIQPPAGATHQVWSIERQPSGAVDSRMLFIADATHIIETRPIPNETYDPRTRPWYIEAAKTAHAAVTSPYRFFTTQEIGTTFAKRRDDGRATTAVDMTLASFSDFLGALRPTKSAELLIFDAQNRIVADANESSASRAKPSTADAANLRDIATSGRPVLLELAAGKAASDGGMRSIETGSGTWHGIVARLHEPGPALYFAVAAPQSELLADAVRTRNESLFVTLAAMLVSIVLTIACARLASRPLRALTDEAAAIRALKFEQGSDVASQISEIDALAETMESMKETIRRFLGIGAALAGERNFDRLLERLLTETTHLASARGGIVYLPESDGSFRCALAHWDDKPLARKLPDLYPQGHRDHPVIGAIAEGKVARTANVPELLRWYPGLPDDAGLTNLAVALRNRQGEVVGVLSLLQDVGALGNARESEILALVEGLSGTAASAIDSQRLILEQKRLIEAVIELMADAIDRKSPYTGGHCARVPELTKMIARAAQAQTAGPFKDFALDDDQWEELHIAAWLHDCGKVTSPEYVVDKATKLETIYDRLHEIRMRFEVVKREAEIACWRDIADGAPREPRLAVLRQTCETLDNEFAFVAECNEGGEFMAAEKIMRLRQIAARTWTRTLDDRIGLSEEEKRRKERTPAPSLPIAEALIADKPEHVFERREQDRIAPDNQWGFKIDVPPDLYNRGELYNLTVGRGTLTTEDRYKINEHIVETIRMLSRLPLPRHLSQVVEIASGHHEKMDGTGYPRRLKRDEMSCTARMMAVADIFEALTAADRPYKKPKTLSESLEIMARMRDEAHIDPDIFELVLSARVYQTYAERFLSPEQIDPVEPSNYRRP